MILRKWDYETHKYLKHEIPDNWYVPLISKVGDKVNCPHCGKEIIFGETFTSLEIHTPVGLGYGVCDKCYQEKWNRKRKYKVN